MSPLNYVTLYNIFDNNRGIIGRILAPARWLIRFLANTRIVPYLEKESIQPQFLGERLEKQVVVSLTSFPARIDSVWIVVKTMLLQSYTPDKVILWLSKEQFPNKNSIPENLKQLEGNIFEIRYVEGDLRSHKKYFYAFSEFRDDIVITIDDDIYYSMHLIRDLLRLHKSYPGSVICNYGLYITYKPDGSLNPYNKWSRNNNGNKFFFGSGGGTLYEPKLLHPDTLNVNLFTKLTPLADDIWQNTMVRLSNVPIVVLSNHHVLSIIQKEDIRLCDQNVTENMNDKQLLSVIDYCVSNYKINPFEK